MEAVNDDLVASVVMRWGAQLGKTEILCNIVGYFIDADPSPILMVQPTVDLAEAWSKERLAPMLRDTPVLHNRIHAPRSRDAENTILHKTFFGGSIAMVGANAPTGLAGRPRRVILLDEIDRYPPSAGSEGDPCALAERRAESFHNAVIVKTSTPTIRGASRIDVAWEDSDQRLWFCPCPACSMLQDLRWSQVRWPKGKPEEAWYECLFCEAHLSDEQRVAMVRRGKWIPQKPVGRSRGYHLNGIASLFRARRGFANRLHQMAAQFLEATAGGRLTLRVWANTFLAESWQEDAERVASSELQKRAEDYGPETPVGVAVITAGVDVQADRLECEIVGWGEGEESWGLEYRVIPGRPDDPQTWAALDEHLGKVWTRTDGAQLRVVAAGVDYNAFTDYVLKYTRTRFAKGILAVKGANKQDAPVISAIRRNNRFRAATLIVGTDQAKSLLYSRLKLPVAGPGFMHFPSARFGYDEAFYSGLTAEELRVTFKRGFGVREWHKTKDRNEPLDARVYAYAMLRYKNPNWTRLSEAIRAKLQRAAEENRDAAQARPPATPEQPPAPPPAARRPAIRSAFSRGWRRF